MKTPEFGNNKKQEFQLITEHAQDLSQKSSVVRHLRLRMEILKGSPQNASKLIFLTTVEERINQYLEIIKKLKKIETHHVVDEKASELDKDELWKKDLPGYTEKRIQLLRAKPYSSRVSKEFHKLDKQAQEIDDRISELFKTMQEKYPEEFVLLMNTQKSPEKNSLN